MWSKTTLIPLFAAALMGCENPDTRPVLQSDSTPFSAGSFVLGMTKSAFTDKQKLLPCEPQNPNLAKCFVSDIEIKPRFLGSDVNLLELGMTLENPRITSLHVSLTSTISQPQLEEAWRIHGACLNKEEIQKAVSFDTDTSGYFARSLSEFSILPTGDQDFICSGQNGEFLKYNELEDSTKHTRYGTLDIYYLNSTLARNLEYVFESARKYSNAKQQANQILNGSPSAPQPSQKPEISCTDVSYSNSSYHDNMAALAEKVGMTPPLNRFTEDFITHLCNGKLDDAYELYGRGAVNTQQAVGIAKALGKEFPTPFK